MAFDDQEHNMIKEREMFEETGGRKTDFSRSFKAKTQAG